MQLRWLHIRIDAVVAIAIFTSGLAFAADEQRGSPQHSPPNGDNNTEQSSQDAGSSNPGQETPVSNVGGAERVQRTFDKPPTEVVQGIERARFSVPTLEKIEQSFRNKDRVNSETFSTVLEDLRKKDPAMTSAQVRQLKNLFDQKLAEVPPEKVGPQISAAARTVLEKRRGGTGASDSSAPRGGEPFGGDTKPGAKTNLDSNFFQEGKGEGGDKKKTELSEGEGKGKGEKEKEAPPESKRSELLDALKLALGADKDKDKDKDKDNGDFELDDKLAQALQPQPPPGGDDEDDDQDQDQGFPEPPPRPDPSLSQLLSGLGKSNSDSKKDSKDDEDSSKEKSSSKKEKVPKEDDSDQLSKLLDNEKKDEELPPPPLADDLLNAAKGMGPPPNKVPLPPMPPPGGGGGMPPGADPAAMASNNGGGAPTVSGGGGGIGGGGGAAFQGDPFGSVGFEGGGGAPGNFNYMRLAEFGSSSGGSDSNGQGDGSGSGTDATGGPKRAYAMMDEIRTFGADVSGMSIVERYHGKLEQTVCGAPEAERVAVCVAIAEAEADVARQAGRNSPSYQ